MHDQPKVKAYREAAFFPDQRGMRPLPEGTVPRGFLQDDELLYTGKVNGQLADEFPFRVTREVILRGQQRFTIYCTPCHGRTGLGNGMVVQRGYRPPVSYYDEKVRSQPVGYYFDVMTNGFGAMPDYRAQVAPEDRWAIAAYIRTLQFSERASIDDVPEQLRGALDQPGGVPEAQSKPAASHEGGHQQ
jgi:mono/diheme cytochrome c family protein